MHAVRAVTEPAAKTDDLVDEAIAVGLGRSDPLVAHAKMLRLELLKVKANLERELGTLSLLRQGRSLLPLGSDSPVG
ncbi:MAG: hypothetical protein ACRDHU_00195 [Actinomycetota bacterium]